MPAADWTSISNGAGAFAIVADGTAPSPPDIMQISAGGQYFQDITAGTYRDSRITAWFRQSNANQADCLLALRSLNTTFSAAPASYFVAEITPANATLITVSIKAIVAGVVTTIVSTVVTSQNGNPVNTWQQYQFSAFNSGTDILLRTSQWNTVAFVPLVDCAAPIASFGALNAVGSCRFGAMIGGGTMGIDDVNFYSLV